MAQTTLPPSYRPSKDVVMADIILQNTTYNIEQVMNTTGLSDCQIDIHGTLPVREVKVADERRKS